MTIPKGGKSVREFGSAATEVIVEVVVVTACTKFASYCSRR